jgi:hypothetical protein
LSKYAAASVALLALLVVPAAAGDASHMRAMSWQRSYVNPHHPAVIKVAYHTSPARSLDHVSVYFHDDRVAITLWRSGGHGQAVMSGVARCATVRMGEPLRGRTRIDGKTHRHPSEENADPLVRELKLKRAHCSKPKVVRHHYE